MIEQFLNHIKHHKLCQKADKILLTVSGGLDSIVMLNLFQQTGFTIGVAHCNFQLRGEESKGDEALVYNTCLAHNIPFHVKHFETSHYAEENGISIQMAARELRYQFFKELTQQAGYRYIATAHHLNDSLETVLLNLVRGTGQEGLTGIPVKNGDVIRPMLFATREMILNYATFHGLSWREDSSNQTDHYHRNLLRNQVIPLLKHINANLEESFKNTAERITGTKQLAARTLDAFRQNAIQHHENRILIDRDKLQSYPSPAVVLWETIKMSGFSYEQCKEIVIDHQTGKKFLSDTHQLTVDRGYYVIDRKNETLSLMKTIAADAGYVGVEGIALQFQEVSKEEFVLRTDTTLAQLDADKLQFPLTWRSWKNGDSFQPLGMQHTKKLSDFFIDAKVSLPDKEKVTVLESAHEIVWVAGFRISEKFKVTTQTKRVLVVKLIS